MPLSQKALDVLQELPHTSETFVDTDTAQLLTIGVPRNTTLSSAHLENARAAWGHAKSRASVDFDTCRIHFRASADPIPQVSCQCKPPKATTSSEQQAVKLAQKLGIIDLDDLIPQYELFTHSTHTELNISGVQHVCHDAIQRHIPPSGCTLQYRFISKDISIFYERENKRKRDEDDK